MSQGLRYEAPNQNQTPFFIIFTNLSARAGYDTRSIFKRSLTITFSITFYNDKMYRSWKRLETQPKNVQNLSIDFYIYFGLIYVPLFLNQNPSSSSSSSSCRAASTDIPWPSLATFSLTFNRLWQVFKSHIPYPHIAAVCMLEAGSSCFCSTICGSP